jgi:soluble lytic murein transglycosylase-like protein
MHDRPPSPARRRTLALLGTAPLALGLVACGGRRPQQSSNYAPTVTREEMARYVSEASARFNVPQAWVYSVMQVESGGRTHFSDGRPIVSHAGAMGLMQVMPATYRELARRHRLGPNPYLPRDNILAGTAYLRQMYEQYGSPGFLGAYNAGPGRFRQFLEDGRPLPGETRRYMAMLAPQVAGIYPPGEAPLRTHEYMGRAYAGEGWLNPDVATRPETWLPGEPG